VAEGLSVIAEYSESGNSVNPTWSKSYVYLGNRLLSTLTPNGSGGEATQYHHPDRLGTRLVTDPSNGNSFEQVTLPFGTALGAESTGETNRRFTSYDRSLATKLDYAVNRHYDPQLGRFTQVDPAGMNAVDPSSPQTLNLYAYCANDPINHTDPSGLGLFSFLKRVFSGITKFIAKVLTNKWVLLVVGIALGFAAGLAFYWASTITYAALSNAITNIAIGLAAMSALLIVGAFHQNFLRVVKTIGGIVSSVKGFAQFIRTINGSVFGTPTWNPNAGRGYFLEGEEVPDDGILRFYIWAPKWSTTAAALLMVYAGTIGNAINKFFTGHNAIDGISVNGDSITVHKHQPKQINPCRGFGGEGLTGTELAVGETARGATDVAGHVAGSPYPGQPLPGTSAQDFAFGRSAGMGARAMNTLGGVGALGPDVGKYVQYHNCVEYLAQCNLNPGSCR